MAASSGKIVAKVSRLGVLGLFMVIGTVLMAEAAAKNGASAPLRLTSAVTLSEQSPHLNRAAKARIKQLSKGTLIMVYAYAVDAKPAKYVYELKGDVQRPARDIIVRTCDNLFADCDDPGNWTAAVNISNTAPKDKSKPEPKPAFDWVTVVNNNDLMPGSGRSGGQADTVAKGDKESEPSTVTTSPL